MPTEPGDVGLQARLVDLAGEPVVGPAGQIFVELRVSSRRKPYAQLPYGSAIYQRDAQETPQVWVYREIKTRKSYRKLTTDDKGHRYE